MLVVCSIDQSRVPAASSRHKTSHGMLTLHILCGFSHGEYLSRHYLCVSSVLPPSFSSLFTFLSFYIVMQLFILFSLYLGLEFYVAFLVNIMHFEKFIYQ